MSNLLHQTSLTKTNFVSFSASHERNRNRCTMRKACNQWQIKQ